MLVDINVLVAAFRLDHDQHAIAKQWLSDFLENAKPLSTLLLAMPVVAGFTRLVTNPRVFKTPSKTHDALAFISGLLELKQVKWVNQSREWDSFEQLVSDKQLAGNDIPDAWLASLAISLNEPFVTFDKGFKQLLPRSLLVLLSSQPQPQLSPLSR